MSKEELLKYLIAEIDLIMHDKDYRFENANGTWYSRESCRDLTNEEVFEELRTELRQFADLEAKLAESEKERELDNSFWKQECDSLQKALDEKEKEIEKLNACVKFYKSYYISFNEKVIDELEKVKSAFGLINSKLDKVETIKEYIHYIDHQINELKGEV